MTGKVKSNLKQNLTKDQKSIADLIITDEKIKNDLATEQAKARDKTKDMIDLPRYNDWIINSYMQDIPKTEYKTDYREGVFRRLIRLTTLKYAILPNMLNGHTVVFKLYDMETNKEINYATMFCENINDLPENLKKGVVNTQLIGDVVLQYYSISSSYISCDGEYRNRFNRYKDFVMAKNKFPEIWNELETFVQRLMIRRRWNVYAVYFHGTEKGINHELERIIKSDLISQSLFVLAWFHTMYNEFLGLTETHLNTTYKEILLRNTKIDLQFMKELFRKYDIKEIEDFRVYTSNVINASINGNRIIPLGYKMVPLNLKEIQQPLQITHKPWREYLVGNRLNDLVINQISPGFAIILDWFLIKNTNKGLFDNKSQYERLKNSELAKGILSLLNEAKRSTYFATGDLGQADATDRVKEWINNKFRRLHDKIKDPIDYSLEEIIMSDVTLAYSTEYVGRTIADSIQLVQTNKDYNVKLGKMLTPDGYKYFAKYVFDICYSLLAANKRLGIIHGDLHLNNATIGNIYPTAVENSKVIYQLDKKYIFETIGYSGYLIDFSRSIINPERYEELKDKSLPSSFKLFSDYDTFEMQEINSMLYWYLQIFPNKQQNKERLLAVFKSNITAVFKLLTALDLYMFSLRFISLLNRQKIKINKQTIDLLDKIYKLSESYVATELNHLIADESHASKVLEDKYPIEVIIEKCFAEFAKDDESGLLVDYYQLNGEIKNSLCKYELFPECIKSAKFVDAKGHTHELTEMTQTRKNIRKDYEKRKIHSLEHVKFLTHKYLTNEG